MLQLALHTEHRLTNQTLRVSPWFWCIVSLWLICIWLLPRISEAGCWKERNLQICFSNFPKCFINHERQMHSSFLRSRKVFLSHFSCKRICVSAGIARMRSEKRSCYRSCWLRKGQNAIFHSDSYLDKVLKWCLTLLFICFSLGLILNGHETIQHILWEVEWTVHLKLLVLFIHLLVQGHDFPSCIEHKRSNFALCWSLFSMQLKWKWLKLWCFWGFYASKKKQNHNKVIKKVVHKTCVIYSSLWGTHLSHPSLIILTIAIESPRTVQFVSESFRLGLHFPIAPKV